MAMGSEELLGREEEEVAEDATTVNYAHRPEPEYRKETTYTSTDFWIPSFQMGDPKEFPCLEISRLQFECSVEKLSCQLKVGLSKERMSLVYPTSV